MSFEEVEKSYYIDHYESYTDAQNERNRISRHTERNKSPVDLLTGRTAPEETILQIGDMEDHVDAEVLLLAVEKYHEWFEENFGENIHILDWALHVDEATPHIHERHVFDCINSHGELMPSQSGALKALGFDPPDPTKKESKNNSRKMTFDDLCRKKFIEICREMELEIVSDPIHGKKHLEKQDFILEKQKEKISANEEKIVEQETLIKNAEDLIRSVHDEIYEEITSQICELAVHESTKAFEKVINNESERITGKKGSIADAKINFIQNILHKVKKKFSDSAASVLLSVRKKLMLPETKTHVREITVIKKKESVKNLLEKLKKECSNASSGSQLNKQAVFYSRKGKER